jgi:membrane protease YdiL (CAAX protease family)
MLSYLHALLHNTFLESEQESADYRGCHSKSPDRKLIILCVYVAFGLTMIHYFSEIRFSAGFLNSIGARSLAASFESLMYASSHAQLWRLAWWAALIILFYFVLPVALIKIIFRENLSAYGLKWKGAFKDIRLYLLMLCIMIPLVLYFSSTQSFQSRYPFYELRAGEKLFPEFMTWEIIYFMQFFALEFFFRGFMVHGLKNRFGFYSVFVMVIPYCMIHFGKPFPETLAAIIAGVVLGILSLKSRSILLGVLIHFSVALTMDLCALWQKGLL